LLVPVVAVMAFAIFQPIRVLPRIGLAPGYALTGQNGQRFNSEALRGSFVIYTFAAAGCASPCRSTNATLAALQTELSQVPTGGIPLQFVSIIVDRPGTNQDDAHGVDPNALQEEERQVVSDPADSRIPWHFVSGAPEQLKQIIGSGFRTYFGADAQGGVTVDPVFVLVDGWGIVRAYYRTPTPDGAIMRRDLTLVAQEALNSQGVNRYAYEAAHLFLCYPK
jgi:protein SCO1/2